MDHIYAVSDIHSPRYLNLFMQALRRAPKEPPCILVLAGDLIDKGNINMVKPVVEGVKAKWGDVRIVSVFGNTEYHDIRGELVRRYAEIRWLDDEMELYNCGNLKMAVVGTQGSLDKLTRWQSKHMPWLREEYSKRPQLIASLISEARSKADVIVLVSHYVLASGNLIGENPRAWPEMYSKAMEKVLSDTRPDIGIHGHAHLGKPRTVVAGIPIYNAALPLVKNLTVIGLRRGLTMFLK